MAYPPFYAIGKRISIKLEIVNIYKMGTGPIFSLLSIVVDPSENGDRKWGLSPFST